ncbi:uncharacterized protein Tco025E_06519 [Trypanosoma conorhini]|uniref:Uncharacterized protein n=1 Tax=Trypanosoma conorhini TaxID=83891 RepID=A0A3R7LDL6_9TRYP|nr:uncharacterized protein Tco025E_06519 [Trypanosoma conorhini]RNF12315.1 hypothetical protein Tco025E_06519 [Trypanosoma conorhini]
MESSGERRVPAAALLREELRLVEAVIAGRRRRRVYRHHVFFRALLALRAALAQALPSFAQRAPAPQKTVTHLLARAVRCGEAAALELSAARVDTVALAALLLAIAARVGCLLAPLAARERGAFAELLPPAEDDGGPQQRRGVRLRVAALPRTRRKRTRSPEGAVALRRPTIGGIIEAALR